MINYPTDDNANSNEVFFDDSTPQIVPIPDKDLLIMSARTIEIEVGRLKPFKNHPFKVVDDNKMLGLIESIRDKGILMPIIVRPDCNDTYEIISGHRRVHAANVLKMSTVPAIIKEFDDEEAIHTVIDSNLHRDLLPSELSFLLGVKLSFLRKQGYRTDLTSRTECAKLSADIVGRPFGLKARQVQKYIKLAELIPQLKDMVDKQSLSITLGVEIAALPHSVQHLINDYIEINGYVKLAQIKAIKALESPDELTFTDITRIMNSVVKKHSSKGGIILPEKLLDKYFPPEMDTNARENEIYMLLNIYKKQIDAYNDPL